LSREVNVAPILCIGAFILSWFAFTAWGFKRKLSGIIAIGGGFLTAAFGLAVITFVGLLSKGLLRIPANFNFAVDQFKFLSFWIATDLVLFIVYPRLISFVLALPLIGAIGGYLIAMPIFHTTAMVYGILFGLGMTETHSAVGAGIFLLAVTFWLAYWVALDDVRKGNFGMG
jgi:hypothetical protein